MTSVIGPRFEGGLQEISEKNFTEENQPEDRRYICEGNTFRALGDNGRERFRSLRHLHSLEGWRPSLLRLGPFVAVVGTTAVLPGIQQPRRAVAILLGHVRQAFSKHGSGNAMKSRVQPHPKEVPCACVRVCMYACVQYVYRGGECTQGEEGGGAGGCWRISKRGRKNNRSTCGGRGHNPTHATTHKTIYNPTILPLPDCLVHKQRGNKYIWSIDFNPWHSSHTGSEITSKIFDSEDFSLQLGITSRPDYARNILS